MHPYDVIVLIGYFATLIVIGFITSRRIKRQEDYFLGGRSFGKLLQTFAAFGAGTGSSDPINAARTTFTSGMSGMWSVMYWLFVTPFYWITGVWYRRMRHLTLGDWFTERYESKALGMAYALYGILFFMVYASMLFSAIGKFAAPLLQSDHIALFGQEFKNEYVLVPIVGLVVLIYGIAGGLEAAYFTDLVQGVCIILLSLLLVPFGLSALVERFAPDGGHGWLYGFRIMHEQIPAEHFRVLGTGTSEFPLHRIIAVVAIALVGVVVQPHFIATGGGSAKTEMNARVGLVMGNFLKRLCTVGWVLTALIALALFADHPELVEDPDRTWGVASRELLGPGLTGLMLACLLAALMSSVDAYMVLGSALVVRNMYAPYINAKASEKAYVTLGRVTGGVVVLGSVLISLYMMDVFEQLQLTWVIPVLFAAPFWVGMYWRRATPAAVWCVVTFCVIFFFGAPFLAPRLLPSLRESPGLLVMNSIVKTTSRRVAAPTDLPRENARRQQATDAWEREQAEILAQPDSPARRQLLDALGEPPKLLEVGEWFETVTRTGGESVFWGQGVVPVDDNGKLLDGVEPVPVGMPKQVNDDTSQQEYTYPSHVTLRGQGNLKLDFFIYRLFGVDLSKVSTPWLSTMELPAKIVIPFLIMIFVSLFTRGNSKVALDRYYAKMKTPVVPDHEEDVKRLEAAYANPEQFEEKKLLPGSSWEFQRPNVTDVAGFLMSIVACFAIIGLLVWIVNIGR